jgi:hypothetical protein
MRQTRSRSIAAALLFALVLGCGAKTPPPLAEAGGVITAEGKPLKKVRVVFIPTENYGPEYTATGETDDNGRYTLTTKGKPGAPACECRVLVQETEPPEELQGASDKARKGLLEYTRKLGGRPVPARYGNAVETPLTATVTADRKDYNFEVTR